MATGLYVGVWAAFLPESFYSSFPGFGLHWINVDGPYNEHLIRDIGDLYLGLGAASLAAMFSRSATPGRVAGLAWALFSVPHFVYHMQHLEGSAVNMAGIVISLGLSAGLGIILLLPARTRLAAEVVAR